MNIREYLNCPKCKIQFSDQKNRLFCSQCSSVFEIRDNLLFLFQIKDKNESHSKQITTNEIVLIGSGAEQIISEAEEKLSNELSISNIYTIKDIRSLLNLKVTKKMPVVFISDFENNFTLLKSIGFLKFLHSPKYTYRLGSVLVPLSTNSITAQIKRIANPLNFVKPKRKQPSDNNRVRIFIEKYIPENFQKGGAKIFDFGCGRGRVPDMLSHFNFEVIGMDQNAHQNWINIKKANFIVGNDKYIKFLKDRMFDIVSSIIVLQYVEDDFSLLLEFRRILKNNGWLIIQVANKDNLWTKFTGRFLFNENKITYRYYTKEDLLKILKKAGFRIERIWIEDFYTPVFAYTFSFLFNHVFPHIVKKSVEKIIPEKYRGKLIVICKKI